MEFANPRPPLMATFLALSVELALPVFLIPKKGAEGATWG